MWLGCFAGSSHVHHCSGAAGGGPESGKAGDSAVVDRCINNDVAVEWGGSMCSRGVKGVSRGGRAVLGLHWES